MSATIRPVILRSAFGWGYELYRGKDFIARDAGDGWDEGAAHSAAEARISALSQRRPNNAPPRRPKVNTTEAVVRALIHDTKRPPSAREISGWHVIDMPTEEVLAMLRDLEKRGLVMRSGSAWSDADFGWALSPRARGGWIVDASPAVASGARREV